jgi:acetyl esterase/lipase
MPPKLRRRLLIIGISCAALGVAAVTIAPRLRSLAMLLDLSGRHSSLRHWLPVRQAAVREHDVEIPTRHGILAARVYAAESPQRALAVFPGVHTGGVDEPRLATFSRRLASAGYLVVSVPLPDLRAFRITPRTTDQIEDASRWIAESPLAHGRAIGLVGVSFAGGLSLVAAGRPSLQSRIAAVFSVGGHGDLPRTLHSLCVEDSVNAGPVAHVYALGVILHSVTPRVVPPDQVGQVEHATTRFLAALAQPPAVGDPLLAQLRDETRSLPEPASSVVRHMLDADAAGLCRLLSPHINDVAGDPALSPERSPPARAPVFLLHGEDDRLIPTTETPRLAAALREQGHRDVRWLVTPAISHAELKTALPAGAIWNLVQFWTAMLDALN